MRNATRKGETQNSPARMSEIMVLCSFIDVGGADIPIIVLNWCDEHLKAALEYWISMSAGKLSNVEATAKTVSGIAYVAPHNLREPSLYEVDLLVRSLLQDPALEYVPPFILFFQTREMKFTPMFTSPHLIPPRQILSALPRGCGSPECTDNHCCDLTWDGLTPESLKFLDADMVKLDKKDPLFDTKAMEEKRFWRPKAQWEPREQLCNLWGCDVSYSAGDRTRLKRCVKCKEALYCSSTHQKLDGI
ncbi:hypothetical protein VKT23_017499 [Stygiomarasmius scandens]|uniref:MYND-type domain-containing protein n=1 Tax=Marasmiellus scandens TaxID=2682957 RepID=A0ABR1IW31_9AGAR